MIPLRLVILLTLAFSPLLRAHSLHQSTAEAEYNPTTQKLEVSLTVFINDLELALMRQSERLMAIDKNPAAEFDAQIQAYLAKTFVVKDAEGTTMKLEWVGRELESIKNDDPAVTLFFTIPLSGGLGGSSLRHSVLCDLFQDQTNLLFLRTTQKVEFKFARGDPAKQLLPPK
jgi:hypothetical protein